MAENIVRFREANGKFLNRQQLRQVRGIGEITFVQAAGFLRIPDGETFFDSTAVHPESYPAAERLLAKLNLQTEEVKGNGKLVRERIAQSGKTLAQLAQECEVGQETLQDIVASLEKPNRDPREEMPKPIFRRDVLKLEQLTPGMVLKGTVRNVVDFGVFVDIGIKQDGLVHRSQMSKKFVKNPSAVVAVGDVIEVKVLSIDLERERVALSMLI